MNSTGGRNQRFIVVVRAIAALVFALALSGCIKMDVDLTLDGDRADGSMIIGVNRAVLDMTGESAEDFLAELNADEDIPEGATVRPYEDDVYVGQEYVLSDVEIAEFNDEEMSINYDADAGTYEVDGQLDMTDIGPEAAELGEFDITVSITFPGEVTDHNGTLDGRTVTWTPVLGETNEIRATARDSGGSDVPTWLLIVTAAAIVAVLAGLAYFLTRRNRSAPEVPGGTGDGTSPWSPDHGGDTRPLDLGSATNDTRPLGHPASFDDRRPVDHRANAADAGPIDYSAGHHDGEPAPREPGPADEEPNPERPVGT